MLLACGFGIFVADQWSKRAIQAASGNRNLHWGRIVRFHFVAHRKKSFHTTSARAVMIATWTLAVGSSMILYWTGYWFQTAISLAGLGLALGGAASNLLDVLRRRFVVDFIDPGWWPIFNLADVAIVCGLAAALFS